jgi:hypothetical protein
MTLFTIVSLLFGQLAMQFQKKDISTENYIAFPNAGRLPPALGRSVPALKSR